MIEKVKKILKRAPNIKAKVIADKLKCTTKEINQILHYNPLHFIRDDTKFTWRLKESENLITIEFDPQWITCELFEDSLLDADLNVDRATKVMFVLPKNCKFLIEATARLLALCNQLIRSKKKVVIDLSDNSSSLHYLNRAGFFDQLNKNVEIIPKRPTYSTAKGLKGSSDRVVEFGAVDPKESNTALINQLTNAFVSFANDSYDNAIFTIFAEMIKNVKEHSESKEYGFAALQKYDGFKGKKKHIQVVISDSGVGIAATLKPNLKKHYPKLLKKSDLELVRMVLSGSQLSKYGSDSDSGHGLGFKSSQEKASKFNARYSIRQADFSLEFQFRNGKLLPIKEIHHSVKIVGTHICFDFDIDEFVNS
ncbi:ATP-binding protein [Bdellovibrio bacteriovorus]|uniref:ATP-binding protein n=1 Tax=Bdellovibrio bacteriovorus TaxID=959 RepID=UPI0035A6BB91